MHPVEERPKEIIVLLYIVWSLRNINDMEWYKGKDKIQTNKKEKKRKEKLINKIYLLYNEIDQWSISSIFL